jgi:hypothetical protein
MNVEIGTEAAQFPGKEYINGIFLAVQQQPYIRSTSQIRGTLSKNVALTAKVT